MQQRAASGEVDPLTIFDQDLLELIDEFLEQRFQIILMGDFNSKPTSNVYKFLKKKGYKSCMNERFKKHVNTFPSENPEKCIDFIMYKGVNIDVLEVKIFGTKEATDHKGIKVTLDVK